MPKIDMDKLKQISAELKQTNAELAAYAEAMPHADAATFDAMTARVDELLRERCRAMGLPEDEIARIEQEAKQDVDRQIADEMKQTMHALARDKI